MSLSEIQQERYQRNISIPGLGEAGQEKLLAASVLVIGAGGLGSAALPYLASAGVGRIGVVDGDEVELKNMQRQVLHTEIGRNKAESAAERLCLINSDIKVEVYPEYLTFDRCVELFPQYDLILDCCDTFGAKMMISDAAQHVNAVLVWASAVSMQGQCSVFGLPDAYGDALYLRDLIPEEPDASDYPLAVNVGVLGAMVGQVGTMQATEALKILGGFGQPLVGRVMLLDALTSRWDVIPLRKAY
ncbi:thiamine biosynthesis protein ThiF [Corynebacterium kutscheri]|uniref:Dinucleotide-utilizing enzyme n=1 Tax=Corynebacterium kutscheri TaxID=35755 RepID=A0A0F6TE40_9CORY|nr:HesA/MoeB/ThiF family protein [Corynebacterium kutscheri]AKE42241.1 dinucleotide-utilizing enzyme [Corynebacterium kutscheri]VEH05693.1 thiamine biosynthesis protein ThiF [Corynebacterium kutscheri]VEH10584.1 thiamine biosynthesis protein ThiF [Corynebacterium kutscheri]VEH81588.1 thiamine biosynthesis protein ThiF [Corynebacterium kutscheri]